VTRTTVEEDETVLSDATSLYDEGGFNYESRQRTVAGTDSGTDPVTRRKFDWSGLVTEERSLGDTTVADRVVTTGYDGAGRVDEVTDSEGGLTNYTRDDRGNVTEETVKIDAITDAVTNLVYDALGRTIQITEPEDAASARADRVRRFDSRGNLLRERVRDGSDTPEMTRVFTYDNAGRQTRRAVLANAASEITAGEASVTTDRVVDSEYDPDGRLFWRTTYNAGSDTPLVTTTAYDRVGRIQRVTDPDWNYTLNTYTDDGRLEQRAVHDGVSERVFTFEYDGHDRVIGQTAEGPPDLVTEYVLDGLDRQIEVTDPKGIVTATEFDLVGRRTLLVEDDGGDLERETSFTYNRLSQLINQTADNATSGGTPLADQVTTYRYDSLGRRTRTVFPDSADHANPDTCTDCVRLDYDVAGRLTERIDQRALTTVSAYDHRGMLLTRTTGTDRDTFGYDAARRMTLAERGTTGDADAVSSASMAYTDLGDLDHEIQTLLGGTARTVDYDHDQAGNRTELTYPGGEVLTYAPTVLNQVDSVELDASPLIDYDYRGRLLDRRRTVTSDPGGESVYEVEVAYDPHRRVAGITNRFESSGRDVETIVSYDFTHDPAGNPLARTATVGMPAFVADDRVFTVDRLNRLIRTDYLENGQYEDSTFDRVGNRESHTDRSGTTTAYTLANPANEYAAVGGEGVSYDAAGNLAVDADGREYAYDEHNRLIRITAADETVLARYQYDALGRRIVFEDPVAETTTRYYHDGHSVIEERDAADVRVRYHVNGAQYIDERVTTYEEEAGPLRSPGFTYYLFRRRRAGRVELLPRRRRRRRPRPGGLRQFPGVFRPDHHGVSRGPRLRHRGHLRRRRGPGRLRPPLRVLRRALRDPRPDLRHHSTPRHPAALGDLRPARPPGGHARRRPRPLRLPGPRLRPGPGPLVAAGPDGLRGWWELLRGVPR